MAYELEPHHVVLLTLACEAVDRATEARQAIARDGAYIQGRFGMKAHPALAVEKSAQTMVARLLRECGFDMDDGAAPPRGPGIGARR